MCVNAGYCVVHLSTCESPDGPGVHNDVIQLKAQFVHCKLDHCIHGVGFVLGERDALTGRQKYSDP